MSALDTFTRTRLIRFVSAYKADHGRDASERDLTDAGFTAAVIDRLVRDGALTKYQVTSGTGSRENLRGSGTGANPLKAQGMPQRRFNYQQ